MQQWQRRILGIVALGGGFTGFAVGLNLLIAPSGVLAKVLALPFLVLYAWGIVCGLRLIEGRDEALRQNLYFWLTQIPFLMSPIAGYSFSSGASLYFKYQPIGAEWNYLARLGSQFEYSLLQGKPLIVGVNIFAVGVSLFLVLLLRKSPPGDSFEPDRPGGSA
jgi:hypothetical protein